MPTAPNIYIKNASFKYQSKILFDRLNLKIPAGKITCLLGPSGVGKTTLLQMIAQLIPHKKNKDDMIQGEITTDQDQAIQSQIAYLVQNDALLPWLNARDNALLGYHLRGNIDAKIIQRAELLFKELGLTDAQNKYPKQLSGGMRQRIALIRTFLEDKTIILMDEPFSALDAITRFQLQSLAIEFLKHKTVFLVTHDPLEALRMGDHIMILSGEPATILHSIELTTVTPRALDNPDVIRTQAELFRFLTDAKVKQT